MNWLLYMGVGLDIYVIIICSPTMINHEIHNATTKFILLSMSLIMVLVWIWWKY